jgi:glycine oxidase
MALAAFPPHREARHPRALPRVAVVGAGVSGLGIAWRLAAAGCPVTVFDRGEAGKAASWAAAGMLAAGLEAEPGEDRLLALNLEAQRLWPALRDELEAASGVGIGYRDDGTLAVALTRDDALRLRFAFEFQRALGIELDWLSGGEARRLEPHLRPGLAAAVTSPDDHQVDNRRLVLALKGALLAAGGALREHVPVRALDVEAERVRGVVIADERCAADVVVLAAGAWSAGLEGLPVAARPPVRPVKGQMLALKMDPERPLLRHVLWSPKGYLVPKADGRLIVGGTVEERGFDPDLTAGGVLAMLETAWRALPAIEELSIAELWTGFRPTSRDDAPILGPTPVDGLFVATGHHRNGILLTPITALAVSDAILCGRVPEIIREFTIDRFAAASGAARIGQPDGGRDEPPDRRERHAGAARAGHAG